MPLFYKCPCGVVFREDGAHGQCCPQSDWPNTKVATSEEKNIYRLHEKEFDLIEQISKEARKIERTLSGATATLKQRLVFRARLEDLQKICPKTPHDKLKLDDIDIDRCRICRIFLF